MFKFLVIAVLASGVSIGLCAVQVTKFDVKTSAKKVVTKPIMKKVVNATSLRVIAHTATSVATGTVVSGKLRITDGLLEYTYTPDPNEIFANGFEK